MTQIVEFESASGVSQTAKLFSQFSDTVVATASATTEATNRLGTFSATFTGVANGSYKLKSFLGSGYPIATYGFVNITGASGSFLAIDSPFANPTNLLATNPDGSVVTGSSGTGVNTVTITITDTSNNPLQFATVSAMSGNTMYATGQTNATGVVVLYLNNGTYTIAAVLGGLYNGGGGTLVVSGSTSHTYALTAISITPSSPGEVTGYLTCLDQSGNPLAGVVHIITQIGVADGSTGNSFSRSPFTVQSQSNGLVEVTGLIPGANYLIQRGSNGTQVKFTAGNSTFQLPDCLG